MAPYRRWEGVSATAAEHRAYIESKASCAINGRQHVTFYPAAMRRMLRAGAMLALINSTTFLPFALPHVRFHGDSSSRGWGPTGIKRLEADVHGYLENKSR